MLDRTFRDRVNEFVNGIFTDFREKLRVQSMRLQVIAPKNAGQAFLTHHQFCLEQVREHIKVVKETILRVLDAQKPPYSEDLAHDLKTLLEYYSPLSLWDMPETYPQSGPPKVREDFLNQLLELRENELKKAVAEINLTVDKLRMGCCRFG